MTSRTHSYIDKAFLLETFRACLEPKSALYCSAPVTSGKRYISWVHLLDRGSPSIDNLSQEERAVHRTMVVEPNCEYARAVVSRLRRSQHRPVIDPTAYPYIPSWKQADWISFWVSVIEGYVAVMVFVEGWQYSNGCVTEFAAAVDLGVPTFDEHCTPLDREQGTVLIATAAEEMDAAGVDSSVLRRVVTRLQHADRKQPVNPNAL